MLVEDEINRLFRCFFENPWGFDRAAFSSWPALEVSESDNEYTISADVPGLNRGDLEVDVTERALILRGEKREARERSGNNYYWSERRYGGFVRSLELPPGIEATKAWARVKHGVLTIHLPKSPKAQAAVRRISVKAA